MDTDNIEDSYEKIICSCIYNRERSLMILAIKCEYGNRMTISTKSKIHQILRNLKLHFKTEM